jgi:hypothetical protein
MSVTILKASESNPEFKVNLGKPQDAQITRITKIALAIIKAPFIISFEVGKAAATTLLCSGRSFKVLVLGVENGKYNIPLHPTLIFFRVIFWMGAMVESTVVNTGSALVGRYGSRPTLETFVPHQLNANHIVTRNDSVNLEGVGDHVTVDMLEEFFNAINFTDKKKAGHFSSSLAEGSSVEEVREGLKKFVYNVNNRVAFLGTPPAGNRPKLEEFYKHIEDCVRASIHSLQKAITDFEKMHGTDYANMDKEKKKQYDELLLNRANMVTDMGIAGKHCGGRYMGEATGVYNRFCGGDDWALNENYRSTLHEMLAQTRRRIAESEIAKKSNDTHFYAAYMAELGQELAIPGTKNMVEYLQPLTEKGEKIESFFKEYNVNHIITVFNDKIKKSQAFREKTLDWIQSHIGDWNQPHYEQMTQGIIVKVREAMAVEDEKVCDETGKQIKLFKEIVGCTELPVDCEWSEYLNNLLATDEAKALVDSLDININRGAYIQRLKALLQNSIVKPHLVKIAKRESVSEQDLTDALLQMQKVAKVRKAIDRDFLCNDNTLLSMVIGNLSVEKGIKDIVEQNRGPDFIDALNLDDIGEKGLPPEVVEWILVTEEVFNPQEYITNDCSERLTEEEIQDACKRLGVKYIYNADNVQKLLNNVSGTDYLRYQGEPGRELVLRGVFEREYTINSKELFKQYEARGDNVQGCSKIWRAVWIKVPETIGKISESTLVRIATIACAFVATLALSYAVFEYVTFVAIAKGLPFLYNNTSPQFINVLGLTIEAMENIYLNAVILGLYSVSISWFITQLPRIPVLSDINKIALKYLANGFSYIIMLPHSGMSYVAGQAVLASTKVAKVLKCVEIKANALANESNSLYAARSKSKLYAAWKQRFTALARQ